MAQPPYDRPPLSAPGGDEFNPNFGNAQNNSGQPGAVLPVELQGVNIGAFFMNWIWAVAHNYWLGLLCFIPCVGFAMQIYMLIKGNEIAWQNRRWESVAQFKEVQHKWMLWGIGLTVAGCVLYGIAVAISIAAGVATTPQPGQPSPF